MLYTVYGKENCGYCTKAKKLLQSLELPFQYLSLEAGEWNKDDLESKLGVIVKSVPQITYGNEYVGGFNQLEDFIVRDM